MKTKILFILSIVLLSFINANAQLTHHLPRENAYMSIWNQRYYFDGDTIIDGKTYTKIYAHFGCASHGELFITEEKMYFAAVREDMEAEKYYCIESGSEEERLIADFDVQEGEWIDVYSCWSGDNNMRGYIYSVDEIIINGEPRKRIKVGGEYLIDYWVEGLGSIVYGLLFPCSQHYGCSPYPPMLLCFHIDDEAVYVNPDYDSSCNSEIWPMDMSIDNIKTTSSFLYPTLVKDQIDISKISEADTYRIFSTDGKQVSGGIVENNYIETNDIKKGIYLIVLYNKQNVPVVSQRIIKQ